MGAVVLLAWLWVQPSPAVSGAERALAADAAEMAGTPAEVVADRGDANCDGLVNAADVTALIERLPSGDPGACGADVVHDGVVTAGDLEALIAQLFGEPPPVEPRLVALSRDGRIASLEIAAPWAVRASHDLAVTSGSARCRGGRCLIVHPSPDDSISVVAASDLSVLDTIVLEHGADPRDVALVDDHTAVISQYGRAELLEVDLVTRTAVPIDLSELADDDGLPETLMLASCGRRVFAQLRRVDHASGAPAPIGAALAVIDLDRTPDDRVVDADPATRGVQGVELAGRPDFDMPANCADDLLYVAEPAPLFQGGGAYEQVDLVTLTASELPIDTGAQVGGFEFVGPNQFWLITHTDFGSGASSHLNLIGGDSSDTYNTFASEPVDDLALDRGADLLFFPDPCSPGPANPSCDTGLQVFRARTGVRLSSEAIDLGFPPIEVVVSR